MLDVAEQVFGVPFPPDAVVGEDRRSAQEFAGNSDFGLPFPAPHEVAELGDPTRDREALDQLAAAFTGRSGLDPVQLGRQLRRHRLTAAVLEILDGRPRTTAEIMDVLPRYAYHWGMAVQQSPAVAAQALARYVALLSTARDPEHPTRPLLSIEVHHWVRSVSRVLRGVSAARAEFRWDDERISTGGRLTARTAGGHKAGALAPDGDTAPVTPAGDSAPRPRRCSCPPSSAVNAAAPAGPHSPRRRTRRSSTWQPRRSAGRPSAATRAASAT